jgi:O-antigen ligase
LVIAPGASLASLASASGRDFFDAMSYHANALGRLYVVAYALLLFVWWEARSHSLKLFLLITLGVLGFALLLTFSRAAFAGAFLVSALFLTWKFNAKKLSFASLGLALVLLLAPGEFWSRITYGFDVGADRVSAGRLEGLWLPLLPELAKSPLWGNGIDAITWSDPMQIGVISPTTHPHSAYLESLFDMGVIGLALLLAYYWHVWKGFRALSGNARLSPEMRGFFQGATAGLVAFLVAGLVGSSLRPTPEAGYLWLAIGIMYGILARRPTS